MRAASGVGPGRRRIGRPTSRWWNRGLTVGSAAAGTVNAVEISGAVAIFAINVGVARRSVRDFMRSSFIKWSSLAALVQDGVRAQGAGGTRWASLALST